MMTVTDWLNHLGFTNGENFTVPHLSDAIFRFQEAWAPMPDQTEYKPLATDGYAGPLTTNALMLAAWTNRLSPHFGPAEFKCPHCGWLRVNRNLLYGLEAIRPPGGLTIISGTRCTQHNNAIGGAANSQHRYGTAADIPQVRTVASIRSFRKFSGIEERPNGLVGHVDVRHAGPYNPTNSTVSNPAIFPWG